MWLGLADVKASVCEALAEDPARETLGRLLKGWQYAFGRAAARVSAAVRVCAFDEDHAELREVLQDIADPSTAEEAWWIPV
jgi:hypothetical protein